MIINLTRYKKYDKMYYRLSSPYFLKHDLTYKDVKKELSKFFDDENLLYVSFKDLNKYLLSFCKKQKYNCVWQIVKSEN